MKVSDLRSSLEGRRILLVNGNLMSGTFQMCEAITLHLDDETVCQLWLPMEDDTLKDTERSGESPSTSLGFDTWSARDFARFWEVEREGQDACEAGQPITSNPYLMEDICFAAWRSGWLERAVGNAERRMAISLTSPRPVP